MAARSVVPVSRVSSGVPVTVTVSEKLTVTVMLLPVV